MILRVDKKRRRELEGIFGRLLIRFFVLQGLNGLFVVGGCLLEIVFIYNITYYYYYLLLL